MTTGLGSPLRGIGFKVLHVFMVMLMLTIIKSIKGLPVTELMFFRSFFSVLPIIIYLAVRGELRRLVRTRRPFAHLARAVLSMTTMGMTFVSVRALPLPEAVTLQYTQPLFIVMLSALLLGETVRKFRWAAVGFGFLGAMIITWPKLTLVTGAVSVLSHTELVGALAALAAAATYALNVLMVGNLVRTEGSTTIALWLGFYASGLLACTMPFGWVMPSLYQFGLLIIAGLLGGVVLIALSESLRSAPASTTAPFEYSSLIFATALGFFVFGDLPDGNTLVGGTILISAGLVILWRERKVSLRPATVRAAGIQPE